MMYVLRVTCLFLHSGDKGLECLTPSLFSTDT